MAWLSPRVAVANLGAVLRLRFLGDGVELMTATELVGYPYAVIAFLERSIAAAHPPASATIA